LAFRVHDAAHAADRSRGAHATCWQPVLSRPRQRKICAACSTGAANSECSRGARLHRLTSLEREFSQHCPDLHGAPTRACLSLVALATCFRLMSRPWRWFCAEPRWQRINSCGCNTNARRARSLKPPARASCLRPPLTSSAPVFHLA
jgi:hypothetical protein